jgi:hypothetical protein
MGIRKFALSGYQFYFYRFYTVDAFRQSLAAPFRRRLGKNVQINSKFILTLRF